MIRYLAIGLLLAISPALAQKYDSSGNLSTVNPVVGGLTDQPCTDSTSSWTVQSLLRCLRQPPGALTPNNATAVIPAKVALTIAGCVIGTTSATCLAANLASTHLQIQNVTSGSTNFIACTFGGTAVLNNSSSFMLGPIGSGVSAANWGASTGVVPTGALNCVATAAGGQLYVEYN